MTALQTVTTKEVEFIHKKIKHWTNQNLLDWIKTIGLEVKWETIMTETITSTRCTGKDLLVVKNFKEFAKALNIKQPMLANRVFREFKKVKQKQINDVDEDVPQEAAIIPTWKVKHINEWTCVELQEWIHTLNLKNKSLKKVIDAISEQEITGVDFNSLEEVVDVMDSFEIKKLPATQIFSALQRIRTKTKVFDENEILNTMKSNLKQLENVETRINALDQQLFEIVSGWKATKNAQIKEASNKMKTRVNNAIKALRAKEKQILDQLNVLVERENEKKCDDVIRHPILKQTMNSLSITKLLLVDSIKQCQQQDINDEILLKFTDFDVNIKAVQNQMEYKQKLCAQAMIDIKIDENEYINLINNINNIATIKINDFLPLQASNITVNRSKKRLWNEMTSTKYRTLMDWLTKNGANFANFRQNNLNGIYATSDGPRGMLFATIPPKCIMTLDIAKASSIGRKLMRFAQRISSDHTWIAAYLLIEKKQGNNSFWFPFFNMLPTQFNTVPVYFNQDELKQLKGSMTLEKIQRKTFVWQQQYDALKDVFESENISFEDFVWARLVVITRIFGMQIDKHKTCGLVPFADLLDHAKPGRNVQWTYDDTQNTFIVQAACRIKIGDELFVTYGKKCNSRFFVNYGFISDAKNDANEAIIYLNTCRLAMSEYDLDRKKIQKIRSLMQRSKFSRHGYDVGFIVGNEYETSGCFSLFGMARLMSCDEKEIDNIKYVESLERIVPFSMSNERKALKLISEAAQLALNKFETLLCEDVELFKNNMYPIYSNQRNIVLMRKGEKEVLDIYANIFSQFVQRNEWNSWSNIQLKDYVQTISAMNR